MSYGVDRFLYPVQRDSLQGFNVSWEVNSVNYATNVQAGQYWIYDNANVGGSISNDYPSLLNVLSDDIFTKTGVTVTWSWGTPSGYDAPDALAFDADDATFGWRVGGNPFFGAQVLGYPGAPLGTTIYATPGTPVVAPRSGLGHWLARTLTGYEAQDKRSVSLTESYASTDEPYVITQYVTMRERELRRMRYEWVPGLRIEGGEVRGSDGAYRELAGVSTSLGSYDDDGDALSLKKMWRSLRRGQDCIIIQDVGDTVIAPTDEQIDIGPLGSAAQRQEFSALVEDLRAGGELYAVDMTFFLKHKGWDY